MSKRISNNLQNFDTVIVGTGFASTFFLSAYLHQARPSERILVLERGQIDPHAWQIQHKRNSSIDPETTFVNDHPRKRWNFSLGFGGSSNCWWAVTPRMLPSDFRTKSTYGVGVDWPLSYDELEDFYYLAEKAMAVSGPDDGTPFPRQAPYPQPPHRFSNPDKLLKAAYPDTFFHQPTARTRVATANRPRCCATGVCGLCPIDAKFTILNEMSDIYEDPRITLVLGANVQTIDTQGGTATGVTYIQDGKLKNARGSLIVLGANALFNPHILLRSGLSHPLLGKRLNEQVSINVIVDLDGVDNYQGSTSITGHGYMLYDGEHRAEYAGCLIETRNYPFAIGLPGLRAEPGKWRQRLILKFIYEDLPHKRNYVKLNPSDPALPEVVYESHSSYAQRAIDALPELLPDLLSPLPVENIMISEQINSTEAHIQGTTMMGLDPATSIVDRQLVHHQIRNLIVLGSSVFPTCPPANPTLTLCALSLWAANHL